MEGFFLGVEEDEEVVDESEGVELLTLEENVGAEIVKLRLDKEPEDERLGTEDFPEAKIATFVLLSCCFVLELLLLLLELTRTT
jgi:hypothetical protein